MPQRGWHCCSNHEKRTNVNLYGHDRVGQLTNEIVLTNGLPGMTVHSWQYDEASNWLNADENSRWVYNLDNELTGRVPTAAATNLTITVTGEVEPGANSNKWYNTWAFCRGVSVRHFAEPNARDDRQKTDCSAPQYAHVPPQRNSS